MSKKGLTTAAGAPVVDNNNVITAGKRGPMLLQDVWFLEKLAHFDREVIPERRMHARIRRLRHLYRHHDITRYTRAKIFSEIGKQTDMFIRFSTVAGERRGRRRTRHSRFRHEVLYRRRQLGFGGQRYAGVLSARSAEIPRP